MLSSIGEGRGHPFTGGGSSLLSPVSSPIRTPPYVEVVQNHPSEGEGVTHPLERRGGESSTPAEGRGENTPPLYHSRRHEGGSSTPTQGVHTSCGGMGWVVNPLCAPRKKGERENTSQFSLFQDPKLKALFEKFTKQALNCSIKDQSNRKAKEKFQIHNQERHQSLKCFTLSFSNKYLTYT